MDVARATPPDPSQGEPAAAALVHPGGHGTRACAGFPAPGRTVPSVAVILLVEDDSGIRSALSRALTERGHAVHWQPAGLPGLQSVIDDRPDVVLLDLGLPDVDGVPGAHDAARRRATCRSSSSPRATTTPTIVKALDAGADDYVVKPFGADQLEARIRAVLRRSAAAASRTSRSPSASSSSTRAPAPPRSPARRWSCRRKEFDLLLLARPAGRRGRHQARAARRGLAPAVRRRRPHRRRPPVVAAPQARRDAPRSPAYLHSVRGVGVRLAAPAGA